MAMYSQVEYWNERYKKSPNGCLEWYQGYRNLRHLFDPESFGARGKGNALGRIPRDSDPATMETIPEQKEASSSSSSSTSSSFLSPPTTPSPFPSPFDARILILGCGNSSFAEDMRNDGWTGRMVNLDFSEVVIEQQKEKYRHFSPKMEFVGHDIREGLPFDDASFDLILAKATFDAILCGPTPVDYARRTIQEVVRCLAPGHGIFFLITSGNPDSRLVYLEHGNQLYHYWDSVRHHAVQRASSPKSKPNTDYVYISRRKRTIPPSRDSHSSTEESDGTENVKREAAKDGQT
ncbi:hypothetical protein ACA910_009979 [Epithemia clementina (nom. ined.)]